jgi:methyltransferase (TIGR00027 family)
MKTDRPSATALLIARATVFLARDPRWGQLVPPLAAEASREFLEASSPRAKRFLAIVEKDWLRKSVAVAEWLTIPGIVLHYAVRKRFLEQVARRSLATGTRQVVVLGAGFDTLVWRLQREFPETNFLELDHPATQAVKRKALEKRIGSADNLALCSVDLTEPGWDERVAARRVLKSETATLFIAEGLLMYLTESQVASIFRFVHASGAGPRPFAFTFMETKPGKAVDFANARFTARLWLRLRGEPFRWGIQREQLPEFLAAHGFSLRELADAETFRRDYLNGADVPLTTGECVCVAEAR